MGVSPAYARSPLRSRAQCALARRRKRQPKRYAPSGLRQCAFRGGQHPFRQEPFSDCDTDVIPHGYTHVPSDGALRRDRAHLIKSMERLLTGYQENLITLEELRRRAPPPHAGSAQTATGKRSGAAISGDDGCRPNP